MRPEEYYESQNTLDNYEVDTMITDNAYVPDKEERVASTYNYLFENREIIRAYTKGLMEFYDVYYDGDDWWGSLQLPNGSYADINIYVYSMDENGDEELLCATAYPVDARGNVMTQYGMTLQTKWLTSLNGETK